MSNVVARRALFCALICLALPLQLGAGSQAPPWRIAYDACVAVAGENGYEPFCDIFITDSDADTMTVTGGVQPEWSADGLRVAWANGDILIFTLADRSIVNLTNGAGWSGPPRWSPDNARIAFASNRDGNLELYVMNADGSSPARLTHSAGFGGDFAWAPDGTAIAFVGAVDGVPELFVVRTDGGAATRLTHNIGVNAGSVATRPSAPSWSPDGTRIAFDCANDVCAIRADGTGLARLTNEPQGAFGAVFSPVDGRIAVALGQSGELGIGVIDAGGAVTRITPGHRAGQHAWSPTGESLAFVSFVDRGYACPADGSCVEGGDDVIYTVRSDGSDLRLLAGGHNPRWAGSLPGQPVATFTRACASTQCQFDASASSDADGSIASYLWKFGDGTTSAESAPLHTYAQPGEYEVTLIVSDDTGSTAVALKRVVANTPPTASFTVVCNGPTCTFDGSASADTDGSITSYAWIFGDGWTESGSATATHTYGAGTFMARLVVTDEVGSEATTDRLLTIVNALPVASFTVACTGLGCTFDASSSYDQDGAIMAYAWEFGDSSAHSYERIATHTYAAAGTYAVRLTVFDDAGQRSEASRSVTVSVPAPVVSYMHIGDLDSSSKTLPKNWEATATVTVHAENHGPLSGVTVSGTWNDGLSASCTTDAAGKCAFARSNLSRKASTVTLTITNAAHATLAYKPASNHDPDGDSTGTVITISKQ